MPLTRETLSTLWPKLRPACLIALIVGLVLLEPCEVLPNACAWVGVAAVPVVLVLMLVRHQWRLRADLRAMSTPELERAVWRYEQEYFDFLGPEKPIVAEFRGIVERRDLRELQARWSDLQEEFVRLEGKAGHRGRPLIMDYYATHSEVIAELVRRAGKPG